MFLICLISCRHLEIAKFEKMVRAIKKKLHLFYWNSVIDTDVTFGISLILSFYFNMTGLRVRFKKKLTY